MDARRRILHVMKYYRPAFTGEGLFMERCIGFMQAETPDIEHDLLVTHTPAPPATPPVCSALRRVYYLTTQATTGWRHEIMLLVWFVRHLGSYQTVHIRTHVDWYFLAYLYAKLRGRRLILSATLDDSVPVLVGQYRTSLRSFALRVFRRFDAFISVSPKLHAETIRFVTADRCHLVPYGVTFPRQNPGTRQAVRRRFGIPDSALVLIFVGGLCARKDPMLSITRLPAVLERRPDTWLLLVGPPLEPDYVAEMRRIIRDNGLIDRVIFVGEVADPHPYFAASDIMTFGSHLEGFSMVVPEAQANGLPVVVRHLPGGNDQSVTDGETGFFFTDDAGFLPALLRLVDDPLLRRRVGDRARDFVRSTFDIRQVARRYLTIYGFPPTPLVPAAVQLSETRAADLAELGTTASILNQRFHSRANTAQLRSPLLLTMIDAEEAFDWSAPFSRSSIDVTSMLHQGPAHRILERYGVVPIYLVDYPVVTQDAGRGPLREWLQAGACDVGTQLHPWVAPPFLEEVCNRNSYPGSLPLLLEFEKLRALTETIEESLLVRPQLYRAGRYGVGPRTADILKRLGYLADSSVVPNWDFTSQDGPDFSAITAAPFWLDQERTLLEVPLSAAIVGSLAGLPNEFCRAVFSNQSEYVGLPSLTARLGMLEHIKLTPEGITPAEAKRLVRHMIAGGHKVFVLTYHTPSLVPGNTPYVRNQADLAKFLAWLEEIYGFFLGEIGGSSANWRDVRNALLGTPSSPEGSSSVASRATATG